MALPSGIIFLWSGSIASIPSGFVLCNGANGTPDLRNRFLVGAGSSYAVGANGGANNHTHTFTTIGHNHSILAGAWLDAGVGYNNATQNAVDAGTTDAGDGRPPYFALAYIMKT